MISEGKMALATPTKRAHPAITPTLIGLIICLVVALAILAAVPPVSRDALTHHLAVPKLYIQQGGMAEIPEIVFSYYPMNLDLLYMLPIYFGNDILPKYIHLAFALLSAWIIYSYLLVNTGKRVYGLVGVLFFLSLPVIVKLSITVYVDLGLIFFTTASLLSLFKWARSGFKGRYLIISAVCCGLGLGTKYNGLISFFLLTCFVPVLVMRSDAGLENQDDCADCPESGSSETAKTIRALGYGLLFMSVSLLVFSPWMVRNYCWKGNPIYPLHQGLFRSYGDTEPPKAIEKLPIPSPDDEREDGRMSHFVVRKLVHGESLLETISIPLRVFFQGQDDNPRLFDGRLNPYLILLPIFSFFGMRYRRRQHRIENALMALFSICYLLYAFFMVDMRIRYISPIIPALVILAVLGLKWLVDNIAQRHNRTRAAIGTGLLVGSICMLSALNAGYLVKQFEIVKPFEYLSGRVDRDSYISRYRPEYPALKYINTQLPDGAKVLAAYIGNRIYYSDRQMVSNSGLIADALAEAETVESLAAKMYDHGFTHILLRNDLFETYVLKSLTVEKRSLFDRFWKSKTRTLYSDGLHGVYAIVQ